jgi:hypothetical protein
MKKCTMLLALVLSSAGAFAANYKYNELAIKDYDEMNKMVQERVKKARAVGVSEDDDTGNDAPAIEFLRDALKLILSRPNTDNMIAKLNLEIRRELTAYSAYEDTMSSIMAEASDQLKNDKAATSQRATALYIIENALSETRPEAAKSEIFKSAITRIRDAKIKVPKDVIKELRLGSMVSPHDPSKRAGEILKSLESSGAKK